MALIVETGTASTTADSYSSVADADAYLAARGYTLWAPLLLAEKEQALRRATDYMQQVFHRRWVGARLTTAQALDWPRTRWLGHGTLLYTQTEVPSAVKRACIELAFRAASGHLAPDTPAQQVKRQRVDSLEVEYASTSRPKYPAVDAILSPYLLPASPIGVALVRV